MSQTDRFPYKEQMMDLMEEISGQMYIPQLVQHFDKSMIFDTTEKVVGCWTDGRPVYQKTINCGSIASGDIGSQKKTNHGISNLNEVVNCQGIISKAGSWNCPLPFPNVENVNKQIAVNNISTTQIVMSVGSGVSISSWTGGIIYITLYYTKTTDAAGSYNIADENDYSTTEKIVGTWDDGSALYQCDFTDSVPQNTTAGTITNLTLRTLPGCRIMDYKMVFKKASNGNIVTLPAINGSGYRIQLRTGWDGSQGSVMLFTEQTLSTADKIKYTLQYIKP